MSDIPEQAVPGEHGSGALMGLGAFAGEGAGTEGLLVQVCLDGCSVNLLLCAGGHGDLS